MIKLTPQEKAACPSKFVPSFKGPWVITGNFQNGKTYRACELGTSVERQFTRDQFKVIDLPEKAPARVELASGGAAEMTGLEEVGPEEEDELLVFLESSEGSDGDTEEKLGPMPVEGRSSADISAEPNMGDRYNLRPSTKKRRA